MDFLADAMPPRRSSDRADAAMSHAVASLRPGWMMLKHCVLGNASESPACIHYTLIHPRLGIALLDIVPDRPAPEPIDRLRRSLDALEFRAIFGGWPPIVYRRLTRGQLPELGIVLAAAFALEASLTLDGGDAWVGAVLRALTSRSPDAGCARLLMANPRRRNNPSGISLTAGSRAPGQARQPIRPLALLYGWLMVSALGGALLLSDGSGWLSRTRPAAPSAPNPDLVAIPVLSAPDAPLPTLREFAPERSASGYAAAEQPSRLPSREQRIPYGIAVTSLPVVRPSRSVAVRASHAGGINEHCQAIILKAQLGEEPSDADRTYLRHRCPRG
jgi:hypothetical protein